MASVVTFIIGGVAGAAAGGVVSFYVTKFQIRASELTARVDDVVSDIDTLQSEALQYWTSGPSSSSLLQLEKSIRGLILRISRQISEIRQQNWVLDSEKLDDYLADLNDAATGGNFEVVGRPAEPLRCDLVQRAATDLILHVRDRRRRAL